MGFFVFNGKDCRDFGIVIEHYPDYTSGERIIERTPIPGQTGEHIFDSGAYSNGSRSYEVYIDSRNSSLGVAAGEINNWLVSPGGYAELFDSYDKDHIYKAIFEGATAFESSYERFGRGTLTFSTNGKRYRRDGFAPVRMALNHDYTINKPDFINPGQKANPIILLRNVAGKFNFTIQSIYGADVVGINVSGSNTAFEEMRIDTETMIITIDGGTLKRGAISWNTTDGNRGISTDITAKFLTGTPDFYLRPGKNYVSTAASGVGDLYIVARWWDV